MLGLGWGASNKTLKRVWQPNQIVILGCGTKNPRLVITRYLNRIMWTTCKADDYSMQPQPDASSHNNEAHVEYL